MDRCTVASFSNNSKLEQTAIARFKEITNISEFNVETVTSKPVRVCSCKNGKLNCNQRTHGPFLLKVATNLQLNLLQLIKSITLSMLQLKAQLMVAPH